MSDAYDSLAEKSAEYQDHLQYVDGASGLAVAIGDQIVSLTLFDKRSTCEKVWQRLLSGCIVDALRVPAVEERPETSAVEALLQATDAASWKPVQPAGEGEEYRATFDKDHGSVLSYEDTLIHGSLVTKHYDNALLTGLVIHLAVGVCFAFGYAGISTAILRGKTDGVGMVCILIELLHGILMGIVLLAAGSKRHPVERFRSAGFEVAAAHIVGHVAYGMGVGLVFSLLDVSSSPFS